MARAESCWTIDSSVASDLRTPVARFDFGTSTSPVAAGYTAHPANHRYSAADGYGWQTGSVFGLSRTMGDNLTRDVNYTKDATFAVDLANGDYDVIVTLGDTGQPHDLMGVFLEGTQVDTVTTTARPDRGSHLPSHHRRRPAQPPPVRPGRQRSLGHDQRPRYRLRRRRFDRSARDVRRSRRHRHRAGGSNPTWLQRRQSIRAVLQSRTSCCWKVLWARLHRWPSTRWELPNSKWSLHHRTGRASIAWL